MQTVQTASGTNFTFTEGSMHSVSPVIATRAVISLMMRISKGAGIVA